MASHTVAPVAPQRSDDSKETASESLFGPTMRRLLMPLASLKLTVALFAMAIFIVLAGTVAQIDRDIWQVVHDYFRSPIAWIDFQIFFPRSWNVPGGIYFPGGFLIGGAMAVNLLAAHLLRFRLQASGPRLLGGMALIAIGAGLTWLVVVGGSDKEGLDGVSTVRWSDVSLWIKGGLALGWLAAGYGFLRLDASRRLEQILLGTFVFGIGAILVWLLAQGDAVILGDSSMRILWQLIKGGFASLLLLGGCILLFRKRAGIVLLHAGIGLMMANELVVHFLHAEGHMTMKEGETLNYVQDIRTTELAVVDSSDPDKDEIVVVPKGVLLSEKPIQDDQLPFNVEVVEYLQNSTLVQAPAKGQNSATAGAGLQWVAQEKRAGAGTDTDSKADIPSAYVKLTKKDSGESLGTWLFGIELNPQKVAVDGKTYDVALRFKRDYKPYAVRLLDVRKDDYIGTNTPRNYSSDIQLIDPTQNVDRQIKIWMNNPLRYAGSTFYQSSYDRINGEEYTTLQVVANTGWMIPYVACMIVATGMLAQFSIVLVRFLRRRSTAPSVPSLQASGHKPARKARARAAASAAESGLVATLFPLAVVVVFGGWVASKAIEPSAPLDQFQLHEFGKTPVVYEGRVKPFDTLARNSLKVISDHQTYVDKDDKKQPATRWLLDVITGSEAALDHKVFRIENLEVQETLGLKRRKGYRYAINEFKANMAEFQKQAELAGRSDPKKLSIYQKKILELDRKLRLFTKLAASYAPPRIRPEHMAEDLLQEIQHQRTLLAMEPPLAVPPASADGEWEPYTVAWTKAYAQTQMMGQNPPQPVLSMNAMLVNYAKGDVESFNRELAKYTAWLESQPPKDFDAKRVNFEVFFNTFEPFYLGIALYVVAFVLAAGAWLGWSGPLNRAAFWLIVFTLVVHTFALGARIYISGRPPVTNLYSSAVFIGWGGVIAGLVIELIYRLGIGNVIAAVSGFATLIIAHLLSSSGDTFVVMQAVLDTQFWLATHVVTVTLGYTATYVAGLIGLIYVLRGLFTSTLSPEVGKDLSRMIYGALCFALFFSFVGTVLGGLWADDSWGRFWGWDPKENGALIIVLWNALVLHARWDGMVKDRGMAVLAIGGNIATSWSWWGVNELGTGLHSYGFTDGVAQALFYFVLSQLAIIALGCFPKREWGSFRTAETAASS